MKESYKTIDSKLHIKRDELYTNTKERNVEKINLN